MPAVRTRPVTRPAVRLRAVPPLDPPFDDELAGPAWPIGLAGQLALPLPAPGGASPADQGRQDPATPVTGGPPLLPPGALATASAEARQAARRFLGTCLEILNGYRPAAHIRPLSVGADATAITEQLVAATRRLANGTTTRSASATSRSAAQATSRSAAQGPGGRPRGAVPAGGAVRLRLLRVCEPHDGVAEAAVVLGTDGRSWAMAFRLERRRGAWLSTMARVL